MKKEIFLNTTAIDHAFNLNSKQKKFYLGRFCVSDKINLNEFAPVGKKDCQGVCKRRPLRTKEGVKIICLGCKRIVMEM